MLETTITTTAAIKMALQMSGAACIVAFGLLVITIYLLHEWRKDWQALYKSLHLKEQIAFNQERYKGIQNCMERDKDE